MPINSRTKGKIGEREVAKIFGTRRTGQVQAQRDAPEADVEHERYHIEVKRREVVAMMAWVEQAETECPEGKIPLVVWRKNKEPWRVTLLLDDFLKETA